MYLYKESIIGPVVTYTDIDAVIEKKVGNIQLPKPLALLGYKYINKQIWKQILPNGTGKQEPHYDVSRISPSS
jgi:hypothetical protein